MPTKPKRPKSSDSQFLFVNEDASTVTRATKDAELDRTKQSHVQRQNFARRRQLREQSVSLQQIESQSSISPSPATTEPLTETSSSSQGVAPYAGEYFDILQNLNLNDAQFQTSPAPLSQEMLDPQLAAIFSNPFASTTSTPPTLTRPVTGFETSSSYHPSHYFETTPPNYGVTPPPLPPRGPITSPSVPVSRISSPGASTQRILEQWAPPLIQHYNTVIIPETFWKDVQKAPLGRTRHALSIHADMEACMSEPAHMYSFLASAATQMLVREGRLVLPNVSEGDYQRIPTFFKTKAIQAIRAKLASGQVGHHIAVDVHRLYSTGIYTRNPEFAEPHLQALLAIIESLGGLSTFNDYQQERMMLVDCMGALMSLGVPRLLATLDPGPLPHEALLGIESQGLFRFGLGPRFEAMLQTTDTSHLLADTLLDMVHVSQMSILLEDAARYVPEHHKWFGWTCLTILHRLLSMPLHYELDGRVESLRIAAAFWITLTRAPHVGRRAASQSAHSLRQSLDGNDVEMLWAPHTDCLLWVAVLGGVCTDNDDDLRWFLNISKAAAAELGVTSPEELEGLLSQMLYDPPSQRSMVRQFASKMWPSAMES
ncbi:uncharacterized protein PV06_02624 [Exophiala oligosperma]|uniref:Transcription factor domain-containing protein n=2 Tax=Chaetothyriales TaxID=34395 RepID=A0A0D2DWN7_9EURO|nr:uncharacterized protein PV06_02624 [Exophiala oligosperma]KAJ9633031.1 hypothetical protein H2204_007421 [Knufia peltigerae]KIW47010.1 hypothetical protein PV06_02624 [Exophiala oligosperma]